MAEWIGIGRRARRCYGFDEVALVPGMVTVNPNEVDISWKMAGMKFDIPILAAAMEEIATEFRRSDVAKREAAVNYDRFVKRRMT